MGMRRRHFGFTVVELAIVLVIIGLLVGGLLQGQEMVTNAKASRIETDYKSISAAILSYQDRYGVLPGDDPAAATRFAGSWSAADNGNGDGMISGAWNATTDAAESRLIWKHLRGAGLLRGPVDATPASYQQPSHSFGGAIGFQQRLYHLDGQAIVFGALPGTIGQRLEERGDDGGANSGAIQGHATATAYNYSGSYDVAFRF